MWNWSVICVNSIAEVISYLSSVGFVISQWKCWVFVTWTSLVEGSISWNHDGWVVKDVACYVFTGEIYSKRLKV